MKEKVFLFAIVVVITIGAPAIGISIGAWGTGDPHPIPSLFWTILAAAVLCLLSAPIVDRTITYLQKQRSRLKWRRGGRRR